MSVEADPCLCLSWMLPRPRLLNILLNIATIYLPNLSLQISHKLLKSNWPGVNLTNSCETYIPLFNIPSRPLVKTTRYIFFYTHIGIYFYLFWKHSVIRYYFLLGLIWIQIKVSLSLRFGFWHMMFSCNIPLDERVLLMDDCIRRIHCSSSPILASAINPMNAENVIISPRCRKFLPIFRRSCCRFESARAEFVPQFFCCDDELADIRKPVCGAAAGPWGMPSEECILITLKTDPSLTSADTFLPQNAHKTPTFLLPFTEKLAPVSSSRGNHILFSLGVQFAS